MIADPFAALGLPRAQAIDPAELDRRLRERARDVHPDRFTRAAPEEQRRAAHASVALHAAHRTLRDPLARAAALLALAGRPLPAPGPDFLEAQLAAREALAAGDPAPALAARAALAACEARLAELLVPGAPDADLAAAAAALVEARFHARAAAEG